jgi:hypothetical protein
METEDDRARLVGMIRRLLDELRRHEDDYHRQTPPTLLQEAHALLGEFDPEQTGGDP